MTAVCPGLAQSVPVSFHAEKKPFFFSGLLGLFYLVSNSHQHTSFGTWLCIKK